MSKLPRDFFSYLPCVAWILENSVEYYWVSIVFIFKIKKEQQKSYTAHKCFTDRHYMFHYQYNISNVTFGLYVLITIMEKVGNIVGDIRFIYSFVCYVTKNLISFHKYLFNQQIQSDHYKYSLIFQFVQVCLTRQVK